MTGATATVAVEATTKELAAAFQLWNDSYRADPTSFMTESEVLAMQTDDLGDRSAIYFTALIRQVKGSVA